MPIDIQVRTDAPGEIAADLLVLGVWHSGGANSAKGGGLPPSLKAIDSALGGALAKIAAREDFSGKRDQTISLSTLGRIAAEKLVVMGLGEKKSTGAPEIRTFAAKAARAANGEKARSLALVLPPGAEGHLRAAAEGLELGAYRFAKYFTAERKPKAEIARAFVVVGKSEGKAKAAIALGQSVAAAVNLSRDLSNEPGNVIYPETLAAAAEKVAKDNGLKIQVFDFKEIRRRGMKLIDAVGRGSEREPRFVHMSWSPKGAKKKLVFVGKGITFDTGGISIKPAAGMGEMKHDMSGAANVIALMAAVAAVKPKVEVHAIAACAENMPDGDAYRPGDIWGSLEGKTVEIINTDAEGRLVLADALAYAQTLSADVVVDNATLTGACVVALGSTCAGWYSNSDTAASEFAAALKESGETMWRMPLLEDLREQIKSDVADVKQTGDRHGGSITAALFLREFVGESRWIHCDIAGPASIDRPSGWSQVKGATGHGLLTFLAMIERAAR
ncbi:MAG TPA: leucyl aminopeptidase [Polyangiaceae bacterium]|jgi:leucyl aminopeptidase|nr:leucyl aminopeptidase [Polyangiaceae bacterium]